MIGILLVDALKSSTIEILQAVFKEAGDTFKVFPVEYNREKCLDLIRESKVEKVLAFGEAFKILFPEAASLTEADLRQHWLEDLNIPVYYSFNPNALVLGGDNLFRDLCYNVEYTVNTLSTKLDIPPIPRYEIVSSPEKLELIIRDFYALYSRYAVVDIETTGLNLISDEIRLIGVQVTAGRIYIIKPSSITEKSYPSFKAWFEDENITWAGHNSIVYDASVLKQKYNINIEFKIDTMLMDYCLDERQNIHKLEDCVARRFYTQSWKHMLVSRVEQLKQHFLQKLEEESPRIKSIRSKKVKTPGEQAFLEEYLSKREDISKYYHKDNRYKAVDELFLANYLALDLSFNFKLVPVIDFELENEGNVESMYADYLQPVSLVIRDMKVKGIKLDTEYLHDLDATQKRVIEEISKELMEEVGLFSPKSWQQKSKVLYEQLGLEKYPSKQAKIGCTDSESLENIIKNNADTPTNFVARLLRLTRFMDMRKKFTLGLLDLVDTDGYIRGGFLVHGTESGRFSCVKPNLQQLPASHHVWYEPEYMNIKKAFLPDEGYSFINYDYKSLQLAILAWYSGDDFMIECFRTGRDLHTLVASRFYEIPESQVTKLQRQNTKSGDFGIIFGITAAGLAADIGRSKEFAQKLINEFMETFPKTKVYMENQKKFVEKNNYVETPAGRRRRFPLLLPGFRGNINSIYRQSFNTPIQGLEAEIIQSALIDIDRDSRIKKDEAFISLTVHDSIVFQVKDEKIEYYAPMFTEILQNRSAWIEPRVSWGVDVEIGKNYGEMTKWLNEEDRN